MEFVNRVLCTVLSVLACPVAYGRSLRMGGILVNCYFKSFVEVVYFCVSFSNCVAKTFVLTT